MKRNTRYIEEENRGDDDHMGAVREEMASKRKKKVLLREYASGFPKESNMYVSDSATVNLEEELPPHSLILKNLYLACDPYLRVRLQNMDKHNYVLPPFTPGTVSTLSPLISAFRVDTRINIMWFVFAGVKWVRRGTSCGICSSRV